MKKPLTGRIVELFTAFATLATATLIDASSSSQVEQLGLLAVPRTGHAATALADGRVLITGGRDSAGTIVATAEVFDPANQTSTAIGMLNTPRIDHTATLLADGRVLIAGGTSASGALKSAEIFDPANPGAGFRVISATMGAARAGHTATRLHDGTVLIAGGDDTGTAEIFKPTTESFSSTLLTMAAPRIGHTATLFSDDSVLLAGGNTDSMEYFSSVDQAFTLDPQKMTAARTGHDAIGLSDTRLLFFGGDTGHTIDEFNSSADTLTLKATMDGAFSSATLLANDKILVLRPDAAGLYAPDATDQGTAFTLFNETSVPGSTALKRRGQTATELSGDKKILVAGGENAQHQPILQVAMFNPARIWTDKDDYQPDDQVILSGSGWKPNENVYLYAVDNETEAWTYKSTVAADANGGFVVSPYFIVELRHLGVQFHVTALGAQSTMQANVKFTDAGSFDFDPTSQSYINPPANTQFIENVTAPKNNGTFNASLVFTGTGGTQIPSSWVTISPGAQTFTTGSASDNKTWTVTINVPSGQADGVYTGHFAASVSGSGGPNPGPGTNLTITVDHTPPGPPSTPDLSTGDDTGVSNTDNITNKTNLNIGGNGAEANSTVELFDGSTSLGTTTANGGGNWNKLVTLTAGSPPVGNPPHSITAQVTDAAGNTSASSGALSVTVDTSKPMVTVNQAQAQLDPTNSAPINFTATFNENVVGFTAADVSVSGTAGGTKTVTVIGTGPTYNIAVSGMTTNGTVIATIPAGVVTDTAGNTNIDSTSTDNSVTFNTQAATSLAVQPASGTYGGTVALSATLTSGGSGVNNKTITFTLNGNSVGTATTNSSGVANLNNTSLAGINAGTYPAGVAASFAGDTSFSASSGAASLTVGKATPTATLKVTNSPETYDGNPQAATVAVDTSSVPGTTANVSTGGAATQTNAGTYAVTADFVPNDSTNYSTLTAVAAGNFVIQKATPTATLKVTNSPVTYNGSGHAATVAVDTSSVPGTTANVLTGGAATQTNAGAYAVTADFVPNDSTNYNTLTALSAGNFVIDKATPIATLKVTNSPVTYNGNGQAATVAVDTSSVPGTTANVLTGGAATQTTAGTYAVTADFVPNDSSNYSALTALSVGNFVISKANATVVVTPYTSATTTYDGNPHTATYTITGVNGETGAIVGIVNVSHTTHTDAGTYATDYWFFTGGTNYNDIANTTITDSIAKANATVAVTPYTSADTTYDGNEHTATVTSITGVHGETGGTVGTVDVSHTTHRDAGTYSTDYWFFTGTANYNDIGNTMITDSIAKATATIVVTPYTSATTTYDGNPHTATITSITGVNGETGNTVGTVDVSHTTHKDAGTYSTDYWTFTGTANYNDSGNTTITDSIDKANATVVVTPYNSLTTIYDGHSHTATVTSISGVNGETGATVGTVDVTNTTHTNAGTYSADYWFFTGGINYNDIGNTTITDSIAKANATVVVTAYTSLTTTYDGNPHSATVTSITGMNGETGAIVGTVDVSHTTHINAGTYSTDYWTFTGGINYNNIGATTITDSIAKANATVVVTPYTSVNTTYDANPHTATVTSITGVHNETGATVGIVDVSHTTHTDAGTYSTDYWFFTGTANYNDIGNTTITDSIAKANQTITWDNPANTTIGTPLSNAQLDATVAGVTGGTPPGSLTYTPPAGTVLPAGANQALKVDAAATINYNSASKTVYINVNYTFVGFLQPIDNLPIVNSVKAGQTIPVKWQLKDAAGNLINDLGSLAPSGLQSVKIACADGTPQDVIEELASPGSTMFRFDGTQFIFNWQTTKSWAGTCRLMTVTLKDGKVYSAQFTFK